MYEDIQDIQVYNDATLLMMFGCLSKNPPPMVEHAQKQCSAINTD